MFLVRYISRSKYGSASYVHSNISWSLYGSFNRPLGEVEILSKKKFDTDEALQTMLDCLGNGYRDKRKVIMAVSPQQNNYS